MSLSEKDWGDVHFPEREYKYVSFAHWIKVRGTPIRHVFFSNEPMTGDISAVYKLHADS